VRFPVEALAPIKEKGSKRQRQSVLFPVYDVFRVVPFEILSFAHRLYR